MPGPPQTHPWRCAGPDDGFPADVALCFQSECPASPLAVAIVVGDFPLLIAERHASSIDEVEDLNASNPNWQSFQVGTPVYIPFTPESIAGGGQFFYAIQPGDSLNSIGKMFGVDVETMCAYNQWTDCIDPPHVLLPGELIEIPPSERR